MRSVHDIDSLRPADLSSRIAGASGSAAGTPASKPPRIRLKLSQPAKEPGMEPDQAGESDAPPITTAADTSDLDDMTMPELGPELGFDEYELSLPPRELYRLLQRQVFWAEQESAKLQAEWEEIRPKRERAWVEKEAILDDFIDAELRLFSTMVSSTEITAPPAPANLSSNLEKLQHQQRLFQLQQEQLQAKSAEAAQVDGDDGA